MNYLTCAPPVPDTDSATGKNVAEIGVSKLWRTHRHHRNTAVFLCPHRMVSLIGWPCGRGKPLPVPKPGTPTRTVAHPIDVGQAVFKAYIGENHV